MFLFTLYIIMAEFMWYCHICFSDYNEQDNLKGEQEPATEVLHAVGMWWLNIPHDYGDLSAYIKWW